MPQHVLQVAQFDSLSEARESLEQVLNTLAFQIKSQTYPDRNPLIWWLGNFMRLRERSDFLAWRVLKVAYEMSVIQIDMLNSTQETEYDQYLETFTEVADVYEAMLRTDNKDAQYRFNMDSGLMCLTGWAAKWCREPMVRACLISLLLSRERNEGAFSSTSRGTVLQVLRALEEEGINPEPSSCTQIPESRRVRLHAMHMDLGAGLGRLEILYHPYSLAPNTVWIPISFSECVHYSLDLSGRPLPSFRPDVSAGPAYFAYLESEEPIRYNFVRSDTFYFVLPAV